MLFTLLAALSAGLLGGVHCTVMCGGIVSAISTQVVRLPGQNSRPWAMMLAYHSGRLLSYMGAGAVVGSMSALALSYGKVVPLQIALYLIANLLLIALGCYFAGWTRAIELLERSGRVIWRYLQPLARLVMPADTPARALRLGLLWGWIPCGLVYSMLAVALSSGSAWRGALVMLAFGLGTLPHLLLGGLVLMKMQRFRQQRRVRIAAGAVVVAFGLLGVLNALVIARFPPAMALCGPTGLALLKVLF